MPEQTPLAVPSAPSVPAFASPVPPPAPPTASSVGVKYAGFWVRTAAAIIDGFVLVIPSTIVNYFVGPFSIILAWVYYVWMTAAKQQTVGKMALHLRVERTSGMKATLGHVIVRETIGKLLSGIILGFGYFMAGWTAKKQGLHDKIADTVVVDIAPQDSKRGWIIGAVIVVALVALVVIAGIVSAIVLSSLNTARSKGTDAALKSDLSLIQTQAEIYYADSSPNAYASGAFSDCSASNSLMSDVTVAAGMADVQRINPAADPVCGGDSGSYAIAARLVGQDAGFWCVDSIGTAKAYASDTGIAYPNPGFTQCP